MDYKIDLDPAHSVIRLTITAETVTFELAEEIYGHLSEATSSLEFCRFMPVLSPIPQRVGVFFACAHPERGR